ncbi:Tetratricopeptide TPR_2 repeat protein [Rhodopseudomonas palustris TIE-1]|uniref:tetratricopeptide repeat protein n=1 Tax=Rhodopseudomonas palustris TaxID=1076 RepID=UPI00017796CA|nr:tetratricopeptide repeat protein [Rhodopseudomonas palustris]ACF01041.1 Tetratricopeptide TPR_2 repeat protein [Rhodopseudomonas palustris TIE-1]
MISPSHEQQIPNLAALFTDRQRAKDQFIAALDEPTGARGYKVLNWSGVGGQGKTALLEEFERILRKRHARACDLSTTRPGFALIDFRDPANRSIALSLLSIREQLRKTAGLHCETFEAAILRYLMMTQPGTAIKELSAQFFTTGSDVLDGVIQAVSAAGELGATTHPLPGFGLLSKYGMKLAGKAGLAFHRWWTRRGRSAFVEIDALSQDALLRKLPTYLGADLMDAMAVDHPPRITILFDTYEALWHGQGLRHGPGSLRIDEWVRQLVQDARGVLFVIAGRDELRWQELDRSWATVIERHPFGGLNKVDAGKLLAKLGIAEPALRERMISGARSRTFGEIDPSDNEAEAYLPFYLTLQARDYHHIEAADRTPTPDDFGGEHPEVLARFLEHLDAETDKLLRIASYLSTLEPTVLDGLADAFLGGRAQADWTRIHGEGVTSTDRDGARYLHDLMRQALQEREKHQRPVLYRDIHRHLFERFAQICDEPDPRAITVQHERAFLAALRHLSRVDESEAVRWANQQMQRFNDAARWRGLEEACTTVLPLAERAFGGENEWTTATLSWLAVASGNTGRYAEAETLYERVKAIDEKTLGPEHPSLATTLANLAGVYRDTGRYAEAETLYERVKVIEEKTLRPEHPSLATTLANLAGVYRDTGRYAKAETLYERVKAVEEKTLGPEHPSFAATLSNLAGVYSDTGRYAEAETLYERVKAIYEKTLGPEHPSLATTLANLAGVYRDTGRYAEAETLYERVKVIEEKTLGPEHPSFAATLSNLAGVYSDTGRYAEAETLYERVKVIEEKTLGSKHPSFATTLSNLAGVYSDTGRYAEAETLYERVKAIYEKTLGPEHPFFATTLSNLAGVYSDTGRYAEAETLYERVKAIYEKALGPEHPWFGALLVGMARLYVETDCGVTAEQLLKAAMAVFAAKLPPRHRYVAKLLIVRGRLHTHLHRSAEAHHDFQDAIAMLESLRVRPEQHLMRLAKQGLGTARA